MVGSVASFFHNLGLFSLHAVPNFCFSQKEVFVSAGLHPLTSFFLVQQDEYEQTKTLMKRNYQQEYAKIKAYRSSKDLNGVQEGIYLYLLDVFSSLGPDDQSKVYRRTYEIEKPQTSDLQWGEHHAKENPVRLLNALYFEGFIKSEVNSTIRVWAKEQDATISCSFYELEDREPIVEREIGYINGVGTTRDQARWDAYRLSDNLLQRKRITGIHSVSHGNIQDYTISLVAQSGLKAEPVILLLNQWNNFFARYPDNNMRFLQICFSQGAIWVNQALNYLPPEYQKRLSIIAIAPASFIPSNTEGEVMHFVKKEDAIPYTFALNKGRLATEDAQIKIVDPDDSASHDPHGSNYVQAILPFVDRYIQTGSIME